MDGKQPGAREQARAKPALRRQALRQGRFRRLSPRVRRENVDRRISRKGSQVYLLDDPKGRTWVMVSYTDKDLPGMTIDKLDSLGDVLKLPQGWKFRTAVLKKDLILEPKGGSAGRTQDDKGNVYDLTGPGQSNFVP